MKSNRNVHLFVNLFLIGIVLMGCNKREIELQPIKTTDYSVIYNGQIKELDFADPSHGMASLLGGRMIATADGGNTWSYCYQNSSYIVDDFSYVTFDVAYMALNDASGSNIYVYKTVDAGTTWNTFSTFVAPSSKLNFYDQQNGFISLSASPFSYFRTTNGSLNWTLVSTTTYAYDKVWAVNASLGFGKGGNSRLYRTIDGGSSWMLSLSSNQCNDFVPVPSAGKVFATGTSGIIKRSNNNGSSWSSVFTDASLTLDPIDATSLGFVVAGGNGPLLYSRDFGSTWNYVKLTGVDMNSCDVLDIEIIDDQTVIAYVYINGYKIIRFNIS